MKRFAAVSALTPTFAAIGAGTTAQAASTPPHVPSPAPAGCVNEKWYDATQLGGSRFEAIGSAVGQFNPAPTAGRLIYSMTYSSSASSTFTAGAEIGIDAAITTVKANYTVGITKTTAVSKTVTHELPLPARNYGYIQPKVERRTYAIERHTIGSGCVEQVTTIGYLDGIVTYPFFSSCVSTGPCTPKP